MTTSRKTPIFHKYESIQWMLSPNRKLPRTTLAVRMS